MKTLKAAMKPYLGSKEFYKRALYVMVPVVIQQLINTLFNVVDNVMVGGLGGLAMSAVTTANKPALIYNGIFFGMTGAGGLMISQYFGAGEKRKCQGLFATQMLIGLVCALLFGAMMFLLPRPIMMLFVKDEETIRLGISYMTLVCFSYLPVAVTSVCLYAMRALGKNHLPMMVSIFTMLTNAALNYVFIFGKLGFPPMGVRGAALGTLMSRILEMCFYLFILLRKKAFFSLDMTAVKELSGSIVRAFVRRAIPLTFNEILYNLGFNIYFWTYARLNEAALPAVTVAEQAMQIGVVVCVGMASAVSVMIGTELGAGRLDMAKQNCRKLLTLVCCIAMVCTVIGLSCAYLLPNAFSVSTELKSLATTLTLVYCLFYLPNAVYAFCFYCLRAGGDTKAATLLDAGFMWCVPVPAALLLGFLGMGRVSVTAALFIITTLMNLKVVPALIVLKRGKWLRNITA